MVRQLTALVDEVGAAGYEQDLALDLDGVT